MTTSAAAFLLALAAFAPPLPQTAVAAEPNPAAQTAFAGIWQGTATARGHEVPLTLGIYSDRGTLSAAFLNGPAAHPEMSPASSVTVDGAHLLVSFDYFARKLDATLDGNTLTGNFSSIASKGDAAFAPISFSLTRVPDGKLADPASAPNPPDLSGEWEIEAESSKGEHAWKLHIDPPGPGSREILAVVQRVDGDTGALWGVWDGTRYTVSHFFAAGEILFTLTPHPDGTLAVRRVLCGATCGDPPADFIARRPEDARTLHLPPPTDPTQQTTLKDPSLPFAFSFPDLNGRLVANTDPRFAGKVVLVATGGAWCPNCHDEAPFLVDLYKRFHAQGLEIVGLDFEQGDPATDTARLKAFIARYHIPYLMLVAGTTDQLAEKIPQAVHLNSWPTSFYLGRDGRVRQIHTGFASAANPAANQALERETTSLIETLLAEPASAAGH